MKINELYSRTQVTDASGSNSLKGKEAEKSASNRSDKRADRVNVSTTGKEIHRFLELAQKLPDVRQARVEELRQLYQDGRYAVDAERLAEAIIGKGDEFDLIL